MKTKNIITYGSLVVFLLFAFITKAQNCMDFENVGALDNWKGVTGFGIGELSVRTSAGTNTTKHLYFEDRSGMSRAVNNVDFAGNWLAKTKGGCLCFDYRVNWNSNTPALHRGPNFAIYQSAVVLNTLNKVKGLQVDGTISGVYAQFSPHPSRPLMSDSKNVWKKYCMTLIAKKKELPSNSFGFWKIFESDGNGNVIQLSGSQAVNEWRKLILNVSGVLLQADYHSMQDEEISLDNFCWDCKKDPKSKERKN